MSQRPKFRSAEFLTDHIQTILDFYTPNVQDSQGGFQQNFLDSGAAFDGDKKHLVSSCRMIFNYIKADALFDRSEYQQLWHHGLDYLRASHWQNERQGYCWTLDKTGPTDETNQCYGLAFVLLAFATALKAGDDSARADVYHTWSLLEQHFWQADIGLYADEISADWQTMSSYRGQNANMHCCEALILAYEATLDEQFLDRACLLAHKIAVEQAGKSDGLIWEHFNADLSLNWDYNRDDAKNLYRPWGFQPGHQTEWTKLLLMVHKHRPEAWMLARAQALFDRAWAIAWDTQNGGLFYGFDLEGAICDDDKYFWVQAESFAAAALLAKATGDEKYWRYYDQLWQYCWAHFVDHQHGAWYRILNADNSKQTDIKSAAGAKCDYHTLGACELVLREVFQG
ncbi:AGE family epimerase/isomerase [Reinekea sp.]|jgi:mannose/cellobiose epimerase-like protein (N-acyl-D-glucosamine 2-epimerase family)|uniref:AGE family epimerase/isomerase n=1 Tax=Reinekea sp. TaxID=1970455 RepID=UPI002A8199E4|nr:AGE family epimerase/isomerase [Reinekea sp.]